MDDKDIALMVGEVINLKQVMVAAEGENRESGEVHHNV